MNRIVVLTAALAGVCSALPALAQSTVVYNPSFEIEGLSATDADGYREFNSARRRTAGDAFSVPAIVRTGSFSMELAPPRDFIGFDTNEFNLDTLLWNDAAYGYGCGPFTASIWYAIPTSNPLQFQPAGMKFEFRRDSQSKYLSFENLGIRTLQDGASGTTNGVFELFTLTVWPAQFDLIHLYNNMGNTYGTFPGEAPTRVSVLPFRFDGVVAEWMAETGTIFMDDLDFTQDTTGASGLDYKFWDDQEVALLAVLDQAGVTEAPVPVIFSGDSTVYGGQLGFGCQPSSSTFEAINIIDRVPSTNEYPQTWADIVANGYVRSTYQNGDGSTGTFGTSVITAPSFRALGQPLDLIPDISTAGVDMTYNFPNYVDDGMGGMIPDGPPLRSTFTISGTGTYGASATVASTRGYPDPIVGATTTTVDFTWTADQAISLETNKSVGNDAFRLITLSSMFASRAAGEYDGSYVEVQEAGGGTTQKILTDATPRAAHLFAAPVLTSVGKTFTLFQDTSATFNPGSPSIEVTIDALTGVTGTIGVQGYLDTSVDPNDDSLSVWLEWVGAPTTIPMGTVITGSFTIRATPPTAPPSNCAGDIDGDGNTNVFDFAILATFFGQSVTPGTNGDLDGNGIVNIFDFAIFAADFGCVS